METFKIPDEDKEQWKLAVEAARKDRPKFLESIQKEIQNAIDLINKFDKIYVVGALGSRLMQSSPNFQNQFLATYNGPDKEEAKNELQLDDDEIEVVLEHAMSISTASFNENKNVLPADNDIKDIYEQLKKVKSLINFWELSAEIPSGGNESDHWLRTNVMQESINVRGSGYQLHIQEVFNEIFQPHNGFLEQYYGFNATDIYDTVLKLDHLVYSKIGNALGAIEGNKRFMAWWEHKGDDKVYSDMDETGKNPFQQFAAENKDITIPEDGMGIVAFLLDDIEAYSKIFWVLPDSDKEKKIFERLSIEFGANTVFFQPLKFKGFPLNDTLIKQKPLIKENDKYYHFSISLAYRNIFQIVEELIKSADAVYYDNSYKGNSNVNSKDNYIERKVLALFQKILPDTTFYHSLDYQIIEDGQNKTPELDILGVSADTIYIIEVKSGELNIKHRRGAMKGLKDRLEETINEGSYQCYRAMKHISDAENPTFQYNVGGSKNTLTIDKKSIQTYFKISVTFEHFFSIAANLKFLINSGVLSPAFKWTWIVSIYDLMVFADLIQSEADFKEYLTHRIALYDRNDIAFLDEIDILGFYFDGNFPLGAEKENEILQIINFKDKIETYYTRAGVGMPDVIKPTKKIK